MRGLFVAGTDTGVGKTVLSAALLASMRARGEPVRAFKPVVTGLDELPSTSLPGSWPADHVLLGEIAGMAAEEVAPLRYGPPASPHLAARLAGERIEPAWLLAYARALAGGDGARAGEGIDREGRGERTLIVEGVGGLLVPLDGDYTLRELAVELGLAVVIAARAGLGTINHTLLTLSVARAAGLEVRAVVLTPWPREPSTLELSNRETIARLGEVEVLTLETLAGPDRAELARAGSTLPWEGWLAPP